MLKWSDILVLAREGNPPPDHRHERTDAEWRERLSLDRFHVLRQSGTERPFSSEMCSKFEEGRYACGACGTLLFDAQEKFESGTGWPSFTQPVADNAIAYHSDAGYGQVRIEAVCNSCDSHLGHVFPDGPPPSGLRYCMNALALEKVKG